MQWRFDGVRCSNRRFAGTTSAVYFLVCMLLTGCATHSHRIGAAREHFYAGQLSAASNVLTELAEEHPADVDAVSLDLAMIQLLVGQPAEAEQTFRRVRDNFDHLEQSSLIESGASLLTDDQRLAYSGESYEKVLTRVFLAMSNLLGNGQDAEAYSLQINAKQNELLEKAGTEHGENASATYTPLAIGPYLRGTIREATMNNYDDAARSYHQVVSWQPDFLAGKADLARAENGTHSQPGHGVLYVFALVNRGPIKEQAIEVPTSQALLIADRILSVVGEYDVPPTLAPIKIPRIAVPPREVDHLALSVNDQAAGATEIICDIADLARRQEAVERPHVMARAVARRVVKKAAVYATKDYLETDSALSDFALSAVGVAWEATEAADTRCWGLLPREIQVLRVELPKGRHIIRLDPVLVSHATRTGPATEVDVQDGRNTYLLAHFPGPQPVGQLVQGTP